MKTKLLKTFYVLSVLFLIPIQGIEIAIPESTEKKLLPEPSEPQSFAYGRIGAFAWIVFPAGIEAAIGYRFRSEKWGSGPLINVSAARYLGVYSAFPTISFKYEILYYPKSWGDWYWGFMPGISAARGRYESGIKWEYIPNLELVFGKEFETFNRKKQFYYFSINPIAVISFNYGWSF